MKTKNTITCGVNKALFRPYKFEDHIWYQNQGPRGDLLHLANRSVKIAGTYWLKKVGGQHWMNLGMITDAEKEAFNTWMGATLPSGLSVDSDLIKTFFRGTEDQQIGKTTITNYVGSCPNIFQKMVVPMGPAFVTYNKQSYLNTWYDDMIAADEENLAIGKLVLLMCYGGLCNGHVDTKNLSSEADRIYQMILTNSYDNVEFRFFIYWMAALRQRPGVNLLTNIWLLGRLEGLGKGTIVDIMSWVLGKEFVGVLNQAEIEAGWNDHLVGKQLIEINEFDTSGKMNAKAWRKWIKGHTIEPSLKVRQRNTTSYNVLHIGNFIVTSNVEDMDIADDNDRRNQFIKTTDNPWWVQFAASLQIKYLKPAPEKVASGFAFILDQVEVDYDFISRSFKNEFRKTVVSNAQNEVEAWASSDPTIKRGEWTRAMDFYDEFKKWFIRANPSDKIPTLSKWGSQMGRAGNLGVVKREARAGVEYCFDVIPEIQTHKLEDVAQTMSSVTHEDTSIVVYDLDVADDKMPDFTALTPLEKMRAHLKNLGD